MPHAHRAAMILTVGIVATFASIPASGQIVPDAKNNRGSSWTPPPRYMDHAPAAPLFAPPAPGATLAPGGMPPLTGGISQLQAMDLLTAGGFKNIMTPQPTAYGGWTAYASWQGRKVRATVDPQGKVAMAE